MNATRNTHHIVWPDISDSELTIVTVINDLFPDSTSMNRDTLAFVDIGGSHEHLVYVVDLGEDGGAVCLVGKGENKGSRSMKRVTHGSRETFQSPSGISNYLGMFGEPILNSMIGGDVNPL